LSNRERGAGNHAEPDLVQSSRRLWRRAVRRFHRAVRGLLRCRSVGTHPPQYRSAQEQFQASAADLENVKLELQTELAVDYFEAHSLDRQKQILDDNVKAYEKAFELTTNRYKGGVASKAEVAQAQTQLNQTQAVDIDVTVARSNYNHAIAVLIGKPPEGFEVPVSPLT